MITPVYNGARHIDECIRSVRAQSYANWVHIVADNASTDDTVARATAAADGDERVRVLTDEHHVDMMASWNRALSLAPPEAEWIKVVFGDDTLFPDCLARMTAAGADPEVVMVAGYRKEGVRLFPQGIPLTETRVDGREVARRILLDTVDMVGYPTHVMLRAERVRAMGFRFDEVPWPPGLPDPPVAWAIDKDPLIGLLVQGDLAFVHGLLTHQRSTDDGGTATTVRLRMHLPGDLALLLRCGPEVLGPEGCARHARTLVRRYSMLLAKQAVKARPLRDPEFRRYHRAATDALARSLHDLGMTGPARVLGTWARFLAVVERFTG